MATAGITFFVTRFTEDEAHDGGIPYDDEHTTENAAEYDPLWHDVPRVDWAIDTIRKEGLCFDGGSDWAVDPDGSQIVNYGTAEREEVSAHLFGFAPSEVRAIMHGARYGHWNR